MSNIAAKPLSVVNSSGADAQVLARAYGGTVVLACGGASLARAPFDLLSSRGVLLAAVNQVAATHVRPHFWFSVDPPERFHSVIWDDPAIMKFVRRNNSRHCIRRESATGWSKTLEPATSFANTWFYEHRTGMEPHQFLTDPRATWGTCPRTRGTEAETRSVMLVAIRVLHWLGFSRILLLGCDFDEHASYAFEVNTDEYCVQGHRKTFQQLDTWFTRLRPYLEEAGTEIINCTPGSKLTAFEHQPIEQALKVLQPATNVRGLYR